MSDERTELMGAVGEGSDLASESTDVSLEPKSVALIAV